MSQFLTQLGRAGVAFALTSIVGVSSAQAQSAIVTTTFPNGSATFQINGAPVVPNMAPQPVYYENPVVYSEEPQPLYVEYQPPPPVTVVEPMPAPIPGYLWVAAHYAWSGTSWVWTPGRWIAEQQNSTWIAPYYDSGRQVWRHGHWRRGHIQPSYPVGFRGPTPYYAPRGPVVVQAPGPYHRGPVVVQAPGPYHRGPVVVQAPRPYHRGPVVVQAPRPHHRGPVVVQAPQPQYRPNPFPGQRGPGHGGGPGHGRGQGHRRGH